MRSRFMIRLGMKEAERGSAMVIMLLVMAVLTGLGAVIFNVSLGNLQNAGRDRFAGGALGAAEAGVAQAVAFVRENGVGTLTCTGVTSTACSSDYGHAFNNGDWHIECIPTKATPPCTSGGRQVRVWIQLVQKLTPAQKTGKFTIHSMGIQWNKTPSSLSVAETCGQIPANKVRGCRSIDQTITVTPLKFPLGMYGSEGISNNGSSQVKKESMFSSGCIFKRANVAFDTSAVDPAFPTVVPAAHSTKYISSAQAGNLLNLPDNCVPGDSKNIHKNGPCNTDNQAPAGMVDVQYDQDSEGAGVTSTVCANKPPDNTSKFTDADLKTYGFGPPKGLTPSEYALLRSKAQSQGTFYDCTVNPPVPANADCSTNSLNSFTPLTSASPPNVVLYIKLGTGGKVNIQSNQITGYDPSTCGSRSIVIVVEGQDAQLVVNNGATLIGAVFVPDGIASFSGSSAIAGTIFAKILDLSGNGGGTFTLQPDNTPSDCFFTNFPLVKVLPGVFRELDR